MERDRNGERGTEREEGAKERERGERQREREEERERERKIERGTEREREEKQRGREIYRDDSNINKNQTMPGMSVEAKSLDIPGDVSAGS